MQTPNKTEREARYTLSVAVRPLGNHASEDGEHIIARTGDDREELLSRARELAAEGRRTGSVEIVDEYEEVRIIPWHRINSIDVLG